MRCVAVEVPGAPQPMAVSMSGPTTRMTDEVIRLAVPRLHEAADRIVAELDGNVVGGIHLRHPPSPPSR